MSDAPEQDEPITLQEACKLRFRNRIKVASLFLEDTPELFTMHHNHHLACVIQTAIEEYIADAQRNYDGPSVPGFEAGFAENH